MKNLVIMITTLFLSFTDLLAHPGPIGHTHDDDWPFELLIAMVMIALLVSMFKKFFYTKG